MARRSEKHLKWYGGLAVGLLLLCMVAAFNLQKFPFFAGTKYHAEFADASGLKVGDIVEVAGIRVGRVNGMQIEGDHIRVDFDVHGTKFGDQSTASIEVLNLLGQKYLNLRPIGSTDMPEDGTIKCSGTSVCHTTAGYDIVGALSDLTETTGAINKPQLSRALSTLAQTLDAAAPNVKGSFTGLSRLSQTIASRDDELRSLLTHAKSVSDLLNSHSGDITALMKSADAVFAELNQRRQDIDALLVSTKNLAVQLKGVATDNQAQIGDALKQLNGALTYLNARKQELNDTIHYYGPYASILINIIGTGPWFDAYLPNLPGLTTGEFVPGVRKY
jgi:phospholipid/cholesterol/gamma-HCH transport system substrate-binding protein